MERLTKDEREALKVIRLFSKLSKEQRAFIESYLEGVRRREEEQEYEKRCEAGGWDRECVTYVRGSSRQQRWCEEQKGCSDRCAWRAEYGFI